MKQASIYILGLLIIASCNRPAKQPDKNDTLAKKISIVQKAVEPPVVLIDTVPKVALPDSVIQVPISNDVFKPVAIKILDDEDYNGQDIDVKLAKRKWIGLFYKNNKYYLKDTKIRFVSEHSEMDDAGQSTGWHIKNTVKDSCMMFISGMDSLVVGPVNPAPFRWKEFRNPGEKLEFNYNGVVYTLYTTGHIVKDPQYGNTIYGYKLYLAANIKGHYFNQVLWALRKDISYGGGGDMSEGVYIDFAGDLDRDNIPDFIISTSGFSYANTFLYLSKNGGDKAIVKIAAHFGISD